VSWKVDRIVNADSLGPPWRRSRVVTDEATAGRPIRRIDDRLLEARSGQRFLFWASGNRSDRVGPPGRLAGIV
jgi:hypothetical protein